jgi:hypothetical protein
VRPTYQLRVWREDDWWLARVVEASDGADPAPLNALTQARSLARIESMGRDLIATVLDADEETFDIEIEYVLHGDAAELVSQAKGARAWLDAAQDLWQERSAVTVRALAGMGYSLRETATLLGLSHQRVDQLLEGHADNKQSTVLVFQCKCSMNAESRNPASPESANIDAVLVVNSNRALHDTWTASDGSVMESHFRDCVKAITRQVESYISQRSHSSGLSKKAE